MSRASLSTIVLHLALGLLAGCQTRPPAPPPGVAASLPFGAIDINELNFELESKLQRSLMQTLEDPAGRNAGVAEKGERAIDILGLTGGGSRGAFGAGLLCGWSEEGSRPDFKIVTGVSTGALQATFAFLGPEYDSNLKEIYTTLESADLYRKRSMLSVLFSDAANDASGLESMIERYFTAEVVEAVAEKYRRGYRLYVGTTNLDTTEFIIWDMGRIASSERDDALEQYRRVLLASCSIPVFFPPVYFEIEGDDGETYHEMHVDGSTYANLCLRGFMLDLEDAIEGAGLIMGRYDIRIFVIRNGRRDSASERIPVSGRSLSIAETTIRTLFKVSSTSAMYRSYVLAARNDIDFNLAVIPDGYELDHEMTNFDAESMNLLFEHGYEQSSQGFSWLKAPPFIDPDERF